MSTGLPWPQELPTPRRPWIALTGVYLGLLALGALGLAVLALFGNEPAIAASLFVAALCLGLIANLAMTLRRRRRSIRPITLTATGIRMPYSRSTGYNLALLMLLITLAAGGYVITGLTGAPVPPFEQSPSPFTMVVFGAIALICLWFFVELARGLRAGAAVVLTPAGIWHRGWTFEHFAPWDSVRDVVAVPDARGLPEIAALAHRTPETRIRNTGWLWKQEEFKRLPDLVVAGRWLAVDSAVAYHAIRYYLAHPETRPELTTEAALHRIRSRQLLD